MLEIRTEIDICAPARRVWEVLLDFPSHPEWNPFVRSISGAAVKGRRLCVSVQPEPGKGMTFRPTVLSAEPGKELRWRGRFLVPGLFDGEHFFELHETDSERTRFVHGERFSGVLVALLKASLDGPTRSGFVRMNQALKERAESGH
jgi:hypothetical protein